MTPHNLWTSEEDRSSTMDRIMAERKNASSKAGKVLVFCQSIGLYIVLFRDRFIIKFDMRTRSYTVLNVRYVGFVHAVTRLSVLSVHQMCTRLPYYQGHYHLVCCFCHETEDFFPRGRHSALGYSLNCVQGSSWKIPWNTPPWSGIGPQGGQRVSCPTELSWLTIRYYHLFNQTYDISYS